MKSTLKYFWITIKISLIALGSVAVVIVILAFTSAPFRLWYNHSVSHAGIHIPPDYIVILGGGGMPSETGLMRTWYGAKTANYFIKSKIIIALPGNSKDSLSSISLMKNELIMRGVAPERIILEDSGTNTRAQAVNTKLIIDNLQLTNQFSIINYQLSILIVTSPEHLTRSVLAFKKAGFVKVDGLPAFEAAIESDISFNDKKMGGRKWIPGIGENLALRYHFWTQLRYEELIIREWLAMAYYKMKGWI